ncbi:MAG TPA: 4-hydroxy-tetrahydrodipicolinate synthase, partial [Thermoanaerobaculia bacterium]|nr:4-hydroxy-tetrahydrodipicolinate synthase [Thermoanaerobaculia bacterium]
GENPTLAREEHLRVVEITLEEAQGKTPVLAGCGGNNTHEVVELARDLEGLGADGLLVVTPYYNKPTPEGLYQHYREVARATRLPIVVYNVPGRTGTNVDPATLKRLAEIETVVGVKEASGNISQIAAIFQTVPESFAVLSGDDAITLPLIALGGVGIISVASNEVPFAMARLTSLCLEGDFPAAREMQRRLHPLMEINFIESNPGPVKAALGLMGLIEPVFRLPAVPVKAESLQKIEKVLLSLGLIPETPESEPLEARLAV